MINLDYSFVVSKCIIFLSSLNVYNNLIISCKHYILMYDITSEALKMGSLITKYKQFTRNSICKKKNVSGIASSLKKICRANIIILFEILDEIIN